MTCEIVQTQSQPESEPNSSFSTLWVQTQKSLFRSSGFKLSNSNPEVQQLNFGLGPRDPYIAVVGFNPEFEKEHSGDIYQFN